MPFILKAGKALNERKVEIRLQMRPTVANLWHEEDPNALRNELVVRTGMLAPLHRNNCRLGVRSDLMRWPSLLVHRRYCQQPSRQ